ncbi:aminotransferase class V-fold PLP-dependent enzyme [Sporomusa acidovorans]|uniref:cysteine desulfurase n=1 Tax=Sporomusa acidovorans (strain ATCC 49682 / DSM 3132 / Mol) TaxID=1123286 RepID=A0ABZ3JBV0_SPOA4|nr:aminotransferase class V-fold PLP-dependent enzyme [Sporomusa acidovorans]OZC22669.1 putative cysteine desulfurase [Sporomusa acidovorans DSM 3132]SDE77552.1 cysteine desulfurase family protein [Sporomusa acidovorans]
MIYLDNAATTWPKPECVYQAVDECLRTMGANPGRGGHSMARAASMLVYEAREALAELFHIDDANQIAFTHNASDAISMGLFGIVQPGDTIVTTAMEHNAVARAVRLAESQGVNVCIIPCNSLGQLDMAAMAAAIRQKPKLVIMAHASNVTGTIMPIEKVGKLTKRFGVIFMVDAAQTAGVEEIDVDTMKIDALAFSGHKGLLGPQGTGGLYVHETVAVKPLRVGGTGSLSESDRQPEFMPDKLESGTPNTPGIAGIKAGVRYILTTGRSKIQAKELELTKLLLAGLKTVFGATVYGLQEYGGRTAVLSFTLSGRDSGQVAHILDRDYGVACRSGLHCAPWAHQTIGTLKTGTVRLSPGYFNTENEIEQALAAIKKIAAQGG